MQRHDGDTIAAPINLALVEYRLHDEKAPSVVRLFDVQRVQEVGVVEVPIRHVSQMAASVTSRSPVLCT